MDGSRRGGLRPTGVSENLATALTIAGMGWLIVDTSFTIVKGYSLFNAPNFYVRCALALFMGVACGGAQKALFESFVSPGKRKRVNAWWEAGIQGKAFVVAMAFIIFWLLHFSWTATSAGIGITATSLGFPTFGIKELVALTGFITSAMAGFFVAFADEICFLFASFIKDGE